MSKAFENCQRLLKKFFSINSKPTFETFPELPECVTWVRFVMAIGYGYSFGTTSTQGAVPLLYALNFIAFVPLFYIALVLQADSDSYGNKLMFAGLPNSIALVLLVWIYFYTLHHDQEEQGLAGLLALVKQNQENVPAAADESSEPITNQEIPPQEESEF